MYFCDVLKIQSFQNPKMAMVCVPTLEIQLQMQWG